MLAETVRGRLIRKTMRGTYSCVTRLDWPVVSHLETPYPLRHFHPGSPQGSLPAVPLGLHVLNPVLSSQFAPPVAKYRSHKAFTSPGAVGGAAAAVPSSSSSSRARRRAFVGKAAGKTIIAGREKSAGIMSRHSRERCNFGSAFGSATAVRLGANPVEPFSPALS